MKPEGCGRRRCGALGVSGIFAAGLLAGAAGRGAPAAAARAGAGTAEIMAMLTRAQQAEERITSGRVLLTRIREQHSLKERDLRALIKDPKQLQVELEIAKHMPPRVTERETILFDNRNSRLSSRTAREGGQIPVSRALYTTAFFKTFTVIPEAPPEERNLAFIYKARWPPSGPSDRWRGRSWSGWFKAIRKGQISVRSLARDPHTGERVLFLAGGPGAEMNQKLWIDPARGCTVRRFQAFDIKTGHLEIDEQAYYRRAGRGLWYPDRLVSTYYVYDAQGQRQLSRRESSVVTEARLNVALPESAFAFPIPHGSFVQDDRYNPPLIYHEGVESPQQVLRRRSEPRTPPLQVGQAAPEFELPSLSGEKRRLADLRGRVVLVNMFALW